MKYLKNKKCILIIISVILFIFVVTIILFSNKEKSIYGTFIHEYSTGSQDIIELYQNDKCYYARGSTRFENCNYTKRYNNEVIITYNTSKNDTKELEIKLNKNGDFEEFVINRNEYRVYYRQ